MERWKQCFKELLNPPISRRNNVNISIHEGKKYYLEIEEPTYNEINEIIKNMKSNKAARSDEILPEFIKNGGVTLKQKLFQLIVKIWKQENMDGQKVFCAEYTKKGDRKQCNNYRGVSLLNIT